MALLKHYIELKQSIVQSVIAIFEPSIHYIEINETIPSSQQTKSKD